MQILYIDDNRNNLTLMQSVLAGMDKDIELVCTGSANDFLEAAHSKPELYLIDYTLEGILGDQLYKQLLRIHDNASVIILSAGVTSDLQRIFSQFSHQPLAVTDRFGAIDILKKELEKRI